MTNLQLLISHYTEEKGLAQAWTQLLASISSDAIETWYSSDVNTAGGMDIGEEWRSQIYEKIAASAAIIAIQTPSSNGRPWILWECGLASGVEKERGIIPIVYSMGKSDLASPLTTYQVYSGDDKEQVREVCCRLMDKAGLKLRDETFDLYFDRYETAVSLHKPRKPTTPEHMEIWRDRFETLVESGRSTEVAAKRDEMYASLPSPFVPKDARVHELLSRVLLDEMQFQASLEEANQGLKLIPDDIELLHRKAIALIELGDPRGSLTIIEHLFAINAALKTNPELATLEGRIHRERWQSTGGPEYLDRAIEAYLRAAENYADQYYPYVNAAELMLFKGDPQADNYFQRAIDICKKLQAGRKASFWMDFTLGQAFIGQGNIGEATAAYRAGVLKNPSSRAKGTALKGVLRTAEARKIDSSVLEEIRQVLQ